ncbi:MAG: hypothetical protein H6Q92_1527 [Nitrospirae bacterium]|nr:hypothetical protein [Nitrospirota bacterium]
MARAGKICISVLVLISLLSLFAPLISGYDPNGIDLDSLREPPGSEHLFGTDSKGSVLPYCFRLEYILL